MKTQGALMAINKENAIPMEQELHGQQLETTPAVSAEPASDNVGAASEQRLQYLDLLAKLGIPLVMEGSPAEAFFVR